eukprot:m.38694 g.38694  ORF g.38694 m.38694 type:complete len:1310 (+) comp6814_c1_seq1:249-4178(+)
MQLFSLLGLLACLLLQSCEAQGVFNVPRVSPVSLQSRNTLIWHASTRIVQGSDVLNVVTFGASAQYVASAFEDMGMRSDVWIFSDLLNQWSLCDVTSTDIPGPRMLHSAAAIDGDVYIFGGVYMYGFNISNTYGDFWKLSISRQVEMESPFSCTWERIETLGEEHPPPFYSLTAVPGRPSSPSLSATYKSFFLSAGCKRGRRQTPILGESLPYVTECNDFVSEIWRFDSDSFSWNKIRADFPAVSAGMFFPIGYPPVYVLYGGFGNSTVFLSQITVCTLPEFEEGVEGSCEFKGNSKVEFVTRGDVITTPQDTIINKALMFASTTSIGDSLDVFEFRYNRQTKEITLIQVTPFSYLTTPSFSSSSSPIGVRGGFTATIASLDGVQLRISIVGNFFHPQDGQDQGTWMFLSSPLISQDESSVIEGSWHSNFYYTHMTARAWPVSATLGVRIVIFGGYSGNFALSSWSLDTSISDINPISGLREAFTRIYIKRVVPIRRFQACSCAISDHVMFVFGGTTGDNVLLNTGYFFDLQTRIITDLVVTGDSPSGRRGASAVYHQGAVYVYGGQLERTTITNELWRLDLDTLTWDFIPEGSIAHPRLKRAFHSCDVLDDDEGFPEMVCFGGRNYQNTEHFERVFSVYIFASNAWLDYVVDDSSDALPAERFSHCTAPLSTVGKTSTPSQMAIVGGRSGEGVLDDVWLYDNRGKWFLRVENDEGPANLDQGRFGHTCEYVNGLLYIIAGTTEHEFFNEIITIRLTCNVGYNASDTCTECPLGFYRSNLGISECQRCPRDLTTESTRSADITDCRICAVGVCMNGQGNVIDGECFCICSFGYAGSRCERNVLAIVLSVSACTLVLSYVGFVVVSYYRKNAQKAQEESELRRRLLDEKEQTIELFEQIWTIEPDELRPIRLLDEGAFGTVELMEWITGGLRVAVKTLKNAIIMLDESCKDDFEREVKFIRQLRHPNIVRFHGAYFGDISNPFLVMEYVERGSLQSMLRDAAIDMDLKFKYTCLLDTAYGMQYLHEQSRIHRDLKSANLLVTASYHIKVTDFTTAKSLIQNQLERNSLTLDNSEDMFENDSLNSTDNMCAFNRKRSSIKKIINRIKPTSTNAMGAIFEEEGEDVDFSCLKESVVDHTFHNDNNDNTASADTFIMVEFVDNGKDSVVDDDVDRDEEEEAQNINVVGKYATTVSSRHDSSSFENSREMWELTTNVGTIPWSAPEVLKGDEYGLSADVYSYGIVISEVLTRKLPYMDIQGKISRMVIEDNLRPSLPQLNALAAYNKLAERCWDKDKRKRPNFDYIVSYLQNLE